MFRIKSNHLNEVKARSKNDDGNTTTELGSGNESSIVNMKDNCPLISSIVGLIDVSKISQDGLKISGHLHISPPASSSIQGWYLRQIIRT